MNSRSDQNSEPNLSGPPPSAGIVFAMSGLGFFYGLIALVDPLL
jgi:hypothetical protein